MDRLNKFLLDGFNKAKKWWQERQPRERLLLALCLVFLVGYICIAIYETSKKQFVEMQASVEESKSDLVWLAEKKLDILSLRQQGGYILTNEQVKQVIESALANTSTKTESKINSSAEGWQVEWQGLKPSRFMKALTTMSAAGVLIDGFQLTRKGNSTQIKVIIN